MIEAFPLCWPDGFPRTKKKISSQFNCSVAQTRDAILHEIYMLKGKDVIISTNIPLKKDGLLYSNQKPVENDHGVAVYFTWKADQVVLACDQYETIRENLRSIEKSINAIRGLERWGCSDILNRTFKGFKALPEANKKHWTEVLNLEKNTSLKFLIARYKMLAKQFHPDNHNDDGSEFIRIHNAYEQALKEVKQ